MAIRKMSRQLLAVVAFVVAGMPDSSAQVSKEEFKGAGFHFNYPECYPPRKRRDKLFCTSQEYTYMVAGNMLRVKHNNVNSNPGMSSTNVQYVELTKLDIWNGTVTKDFKGYVDSAEQEKDIWWLTMTTNGHTTDVYSKTEGYNPYSGSSYILKLAFPTERMAKDARSALFDIYADLRGLKSSKPAEEARPIQTSTEGK